MEFCGKAVIVTGSSKGIGKAIAISFARLGANVLIHGRDETSLKETKSECLSVGSPDAKFPIIRGDILKEETMRAIIDKAVEEFSRIDVLVYNAGVPNKMVSLLNGTMDDIDYNININFKVPLRMTQLCYPELKKSQGNIVNMSTTLSMRPTTAMPFYAIAKAALNMFTKCGGLEFSPDEVRINTVAPDVVGTNVLLNEGLVSTEQEMKNFLSAATKAIPLRRVVTADDVAKAVVFLASTPSMQGECLVIDGGHTLLGIDPETMANAANCN